MPTRYFNVTGVKLLFLLSLLLLLLLLLLSEVLSPKNWLIKASPQAWRYFDLGCQAALRLMLSNWAHVERSTVGQCEQHEDDVKKHQ